MDSSVKSALRAVQVLELLAREPGGMLGLNEICATLALPKSSGHALLQTLTGASWVEHSPDGGGYSLGVKAWEVGSQYSRGASLAEVARPFMQAVRDDLDETVQLAILDGVENVYVSKVEAVNQRLVLVSNVGARLPAWATGLGKAMLAELDPSDLDERFADVEFTSFTPATISSLPQLKDAITETKERGYALDIGEYTEGVVCVAVPIKGGGGEVLAAISVSIPGVRTTPELEERIAGLLQNAATEIEARLPTSG
ncbi:MAG: IclR family transcriptional regulator [Acidimicrobiia bacterium]